MKYIATITPTGAPFGAGRIYELEVDESGLIQVSGQSFCADLQPIGSLDLYSLLLDNKSYEVHVQETERNGYRVMISSQGYEGYEVRVLDERTYRASQVSGASAGGAGDSAIKAPIPGLVVKVLVAEGDEVTAGQTLVILEAMKMENELRAPRPGVVATIKAKPGNSVNQGDVLVTLH
jgi:biotin carboxyl carrier protein